MTSILHSHHSGVAPRGAWPAKLVTSFFVGARAVAACANRRLPEIKTAAARALRKRQIRSILGSRYGHWEQMLAQCPDFDSQEYSSVDALEPREYYKTRERYALLGLGQMADRYHQT